MRIRELKGPGPINCRFFCSSSRTLDRIFSFSPFHLNANQAELKISRTSFNEHIHKHLVCRNQTHTSQTFLCPSSHSSPSTNLQSKIDNLKSPTPYSSESLDRVGPLFG
jgi:hypothetical protein